MTTVAQTTKSTATPYLCIRGAAEAIAFYEKAFGAIELYRLAEPSGRIGHAEVRIGEAQIMLADEYPEYGVLSPQSLGGSPVSIHIYVDDVDALFQQAVTAGAKVLRPVTDEFYGDRNTKLEDPFGHVWFFATHKEDVSPEVIQSRFDEMMSAGGEEAAKEQKPVRRAFSIRPGFHTVTPYITLQRAEEMVEFVKQAFGAVETHRATGSRGEVHAEVRIGDSMVMIGGAPDMPSAVSPVTIYLYVPDVDAAFQRAVSAGAIPVQEPKDQLYGDRNCHIKDPFGNNWYIASHLGE